jgi:hypothetical protein
VARTTGLADPGAFPEAPEEARNKRGDMHV